MKGDDELRALAALAEAATPGPWEHQPYRDEMVGDVAQSQPGGATIATIGDADWTYANGRFIAEASPDVVRELVDELLTRRRVMAEAGIGLTIGTVDLGRASLDALKKLLKTSFEP